MTHNTREGIEEKQKVLTSTACCRACYRQRKQLTDEIIKELEQTHHQQLQQARHDWLREEIVKLNKEKFIWLTSEEMKEHDGCRYKRNGMFVGQVAGDNFNGAIQIIQHRYQSELDQPIS